MSDADGVRSVADSFSFRVEYPGEPGPAEAHPRKLAKPEKETSSVVVEPSEAKSQNDQDGEKAAGVLRQLEAGHFRGVADVRLRINFFDKLSANATAKAAANVPSQVAALVETVNGRVDELISPLLDDASNDLAIEQLLADFDSAVQVTVEQSASDEQVNVELLSETIQAAFETLVEGLRSLLTVPVEDVVTDTDGTQEEVGKSESPLSAETPAQADVAAEDPVEDPPTTEPPVADGADDPNQALQAALASLTEAFNDVLSQLTESVNVSLRLPDPSPPSGNGVAYEKFLAMYNELRGLDPGIDAVG